jgi:hypothetical protein
MRRSRLTPLAPRVPLARTARFAPLAALAALAAGLLAGSLSACTDSPTALRRLARPPHSISGTVDAGDRSEGRGDFQRYVAIGTSVSMGWRSDGVLADFQETSWPAQLARLAHRELSVPRIAFPGCGAPLAAPLAARLRVSGEPDAAPFLARICAPNEAGVTLPTGNVAITGARTVHALLATPEHPDPNYAPLYARVLPPGMSQVSAMMAQHPKVVSVELGANEIFGAQEGAYLPGVTVVPVAAWEPVYRQVLDSVQTVAKHAVLVGLLDDARSLPSLRTGAELYDARATFAPFNVAVSPDCAGSQNLLFVPVRVPLAIAAGAAQAQAGLGPYTLSCANAPSATGIHDFVLAPEDVAQINAQLAAMNTVIRREAASRGFAYFALSALYEEANTKAPFSAVTLLTSAEPYGPLVGLDGLHPSVAGNRVLADAAARALNERYQLGIPTVGGAAAVLAAR